MRKALITGIAGQDGAYLAHLLLGKGYTVYGTYRAVGLVNFWRLRELGIEHNPGLHLLEHDLTDISACVALLEKVQPDEVYNLASQSFVALSQDNPGMTAQVTAIGTMNFLESIRRVNSKIRFFQAGSSEMFGNVKTFPQTESTPFSPRNPYGAAKLYAHWMTVNYREHHGIFASTGISFNHESPLRGLEFVTRKITDGVARIALGNLNELHIGNLDNKRDWGFAPEYVDAMWRILQAEEPETFVLATNRAETVRSFVRMAFAAAGIELAFQGKAESEIGVVAKINPSLFKGSRHPKTGQTVVRVQPEFYRPAEEIPLQGCPGKAMEKLDWSPVTKLEDLCTMMVNADLRRNQPDAARQTTSSKA